MKLASYRVDGRETFGAQLDDEHVVDVGVLWAATGAGEPPRRLLELIESGPVALERLRRGLESVRRQGSAPGRPIAGLKWLAPVTRPGKICCLALNNSANADRILSGPRHPASFMKPASALTGHGTEVVCQPSFGRVHPEPELAVVIGSTCRGVAAREAYRHVFGYTVHDDITSPTMRTEDTFNYRAVYPDPDDPGGIRFVDTWVSYPGRYKCADTFACMGPWLATRDVIPDPHDLVVTCRHQGRLVTQDSTANLTFKVPEVIEFLSGYMTLEPGDIISMGTALAKATEGGRGGAVQNIDLNRMGGPIEVEISGIGCLVNQARPTL